MKKQNKFLEFLGSKGFYAALFTCLFAVLAMGAFVTIRNIGQISKLSQEQEVNPTYNERETVALDEQLASTGKQSTKPVEELKKPETKDTGKTETEQKATNQEKQSGSSAETKFDVEKSETQKDEKKAAPAQAETSETSKAKQQPAEQKPEEKTEEKTEQKAEAEAKTDAPKQNEAEDKQESAQAAESDAAEAVGANGFTAFADDGKMNWPLDGAVVMEFSTEHAIYDKTLDQYRTNPSICISATEGTQVKAAADGVVASVFDDTRLGKTVVVDHGNGWTTKYSQLQGEALVKEGDSVKAGQAIGGVGAPTKYGVLLGPHLEFAIAKDEVPQNPNLVLAK